MVSKFRGQKSFSCFFFEAVPRVVSKKYIELFGVRLGPFLGSKIDSNFFFLGQDQLVKGAFFVVGRLRPDTVWESFF